MFRVPEVIGTAGVPLSDNNEVAVLADGRVACVIESYEERARGGWVFLACGGYLVFDRGGGEATVVRAPTYAEEFPDETEVARRREEIETLNRSF